MKGRETEEQRAVRVLAWWGVRGRSRNARNRSAMREEGEQNVVTDWTWETQRDLIWGRTSSFILDMLSFK